MDKEEEHLNSGDRQRRSVRRVRNDFHVVSNLYTVSTLLRRSASPDAKRQRPSRALRPQSEFAPLHLPRRPVRRHLDIEPHRQQCQRRHNLSFCKVSPGAHAGVPAVGEPRPGHAVEREDRLFLWLYADA